MFDNDGTLWAEQPMYFQFAFALDRVKALAPQHPGVEGQGAVQGRARRATSRARSAGGEKALVEMIMATHAGHDHRGVREDRQRLARDREASAVQAALHRAGLPADARAARATCAPTASRPSSSPAAASSSCGRGRRRVYGIPPEQVVGSSGKTEVRAARRQAGARASCRRSTSSTTRPGKPVGIHQFIGRRPIARLRQLRRRPPDAPVDHRRQRAALLG